MKITAINYLANNKQLKNKTTNSIQKQTASLSQTQLQNNSIQEVIGRSLITPFKGNGQITQDGFLYTQDNIFGSSNDKIFYNKKTGEFTFEKVLPNGVVKESVRFIPKDNTTITFSLDDNDNATQTIKSDKGLKTIVKDYLGRQIYLEIRNAKGETKKVETDYDRNRSVTQLSLGEKPIKTTVVDLTTGKNVTSGPLVEDRIEVDEGIFETKNIITGVVYRREIYTNKGKTVRIIDFSRKTGIKNKECFIDKGETEITYFDDKGVRSKSVYTDRKGRKTFITYAQDGIYETSKIEKEYNKDKTIARKILYIPNTDIIENITEFDPSKRETTKYYFESHPNICKYSETRVDGSLRRTTTYFEDGKSPKKTTIYESNGACCEEFYEKKARYPKAKVMHYDSNHELYKKEEFDTVTGKIYKSWEKHPNMNNLTILKMFDNNGTLEIKDVIADDKILMERTYFFENGMTPYKIIKYNADRSYKVFEYNRAFKLVSEVDYKADGTLA